MPVVYAKIKYSISSKPLDNKYNVCMSFSAFEICPWILNWQDGFYYKFYTKQYY